jgi:hypothetical protein
VFTRGRKPDPDKYRRLVEENLLLWKDSRLFPVRSGFKKMGPTITAGQSMQGSGRIAHPPTRWRWRIHKYDGLEKNCTQYTSGV